ncbi:MAG: hypothetical protein B7Z08_06710 [Sphingomonadales bacterium 32-68-7]|nr:MAG: hypothetical protein B7Z33_09760 [Sphingomonadales bacterium 12-68-11]OYX09065.1 MAG: hypothetical protein B7Z08_06710 [Sphingomonadales bacterium 32-68-7]
MTPPPDGPAPIGKRLMPARFLLFLAALPVTFLALQTTGSAVDWADGAAMAFDVAALLFLASLVPLVRRASHQAMREHAAANDANRTLVLVLTTLISFAVLAAIVGEIDKARAGEPLAVAKLVGTLLITWLFANAVYALHYAHAFYTQVDGQDAGGIAVPGTLTPDYHDFAYFAFTLGMTFQTSDMVITAPRIRQIALLHSFGAFVFNLGVIAFTINALGG